MTLVTVGMADLRIAERAEDVLVTYALGSCIAVIVHDPVRRVAGMIHYMLPLSSVSPEKAATTPAMFADTGIPLLFNKLYDCGCQKRDLIVKLAGGAQVYDDNGTFEIGKRNHLIARKMFWKAGVAVTAEDVGGSLCRTARLFAADGRTLIRRPDGEREL